MHDELVDRGSATAARSRWWSTSRVRSRHPPTRRTALLTAFAERGIEWHPRREVCELDPARKVAIAARWRRDALRPVPRRSGPPRPGGGRRVGDDGRRVDPGRPADARDLVPGRLRGRRRRGRRNAPRRSVRRGPGGRGRPSGSARRSAARRSRPNTAAAASATSSSATTRSRWSMSRSSAISARAGCWDPPRSSRLTRSSSAPAGSSAGSAVNGRQPDADARHGRVGSLPMPGGAGGAGDAPLRHARSQRWQGHAEGLQLHGAERCPRSPTSRYARSPSARRGPPRARRPGRP